MSHLVASSRQRKPIRDGTGFYWTGALGWHAVGCKGQPRRSTLLQGSREGTTQPSDTGAPE